VLEALVQHQTELGQPPWADLKASLLSFLATVDILFDSVGWSKFVYEDFQEVWETALNGIDTMTIKKLEELFLDQGESDCIVMFSRFAVSAYLRTHTDLFEAFVEGYPTLLEYVKAEVDPMNRECD
jgi:hypothetical protein